VAVVVALGWVVILALILTHALFVSQDSISNYAHVWYVSQRLWHGHGIPLHMPVLGHGRAYAFPYAFLPWLTAALVRPVLGDWAVTLWLVVGSVALAVATFYAFPELRRGWWAAAVLANPALVVAAIVGQLPFAWAGAFLLLAVGAWRRDRPVLATVAAAVAEATHPAVVLPLAALVVAGCLPFEAAGRRRRLLACFAATGVLALPAAWLVVASPVYRDSSGGTRLSAFVGTMLVRCLIVVVPIALVLFRRLGWRGLGPALTALLLGLNVALIGPLDTHYAWQALRRRPDPRMLAFIRSPLFRPGATYRVLRAADGKVGMYQLIQHGARLDSELFPESIDRRTWPSLAVYTDFLDRRGVDQVLIFDTYRYYGTNEHLELRRLAARSAVCRGGIAGARLLSTTRHYDLFAIARC
jgi:hypothetical protein